MVDGTVFHIQRFSVHDGPGIRTTVFLKVCPLRCRWCHNPESWEPDPEIAVIESRCMHCGACLDVCPRKEFREETSFWEVRCLRCGVCVESCPTGARQIAGRRMTSAEVVREVAKDRIFFDDSGGGITISGGEPLFQSEFLQSLLIGLREQGFHTAVDTSGFCPPEHLDTIVPLTDLFLFDIKLMDNTKHIQYTGVSSQLIHENLKRLGRNHSRIWIRIPVIPGINDDEKNLLASARFAASIPGVEQIHLLPYHHTGVAKFHRFHRPVFSPEPRHVDETRMSRLAELVSSAGLRTLLGG